MSKGTIWRLGILKTPASAGTSDTETKCGSGGSSCSHRSPDDVSPRFIDNALGLWEVRELVHSYAAGRFQAGT